MRQVVLDTETTGINPLSGHRIIEIGCVELIDRKLTGKHYHEYINPKRIVEEEAIGVHGITNEFLVDKPIFESVAQAFYEFIKGSELVIHNAEFDVGFINHEFSLMGGLIKPVEEYCGVLDTLAMARKKHPGQKNNLNALCSRYGIDTSHRTLHGALLDAEILADVYLLLSGGQSALLLDKDEGGGVSAIQRVSSQRPELSVVKANEIELEAHNKYMENLGKNSELVPW
jgi:DNA polymerase-3 subunit epsilon